VGEEEIHHREAEYEDKDGDEERNAQLVNATREP
jgi:hypothetical protein